jgi:hypothetical protein
VSFLSKYHKVKKDLAGKSINPNFFNLVSAPSPLERAEKRT